MIGEKVLRLVNSLREQSRTGGLDKLLINRGEWKMQQIDKAKLTLEGCYFNSKSSWEFYEAGSAKRVFMPRGWYKGNQFIGYNAKQALDWLHDNGF